MVYNPELISVDQSDDKVTLNIIVPENLYYFQGHFDAAAVLPGVVQSHWVMEYLETYFKQQPSKFKSLNNLKFQIIVRPGYQLKLELQKVSEAKFSFSYSSEHGQHASGKVLFND